MQIAHWNRWAFTHDHSISKPKIEAFPSVDYFASDDFKKSSINPTKPSTSTCSGRVVKTPVKLNL